MRAAPRANRRRWRRCARGRRASRRPPEHRAGGTRMQPVAKLIASVRRGEIRWLNYLLASGLALGSDAGLFLLLLDAGLAPVTASANGSCAGILVHWVISSRLVFADGAAGRGAGSEGRWGGQPG